MFCELFAFEIQGMTFPKEWLFISLHCNKESSHTQVENGWSTCQRSMKRSPNNFSHHHESHLKHRVLQCFRNLQLRSSFRLQQNTRSTTAYQLPVLLPLIATKFTCLAFQYFSSNPVGTCENIMKKGLRTVRSFLRFSAQNLGKRRKEERIKHHINQHRVNEINEFDRSHLRYLYSHIYFFTIFHITPDHTGSTNSSPSPTIHQTACFAVSCSNCLNSSAQVWRCWTWTKIQRKHIKTLERAA